MSCDRFLEEMKDITKSRRVRTLCHRTFGSFIKLLWDRIYQNSWPWTFCHRTFDFTSSIWRRVCHAAHPYSTVTRTRLNFTTNFATGRKREQSVCVFGKGHHYARITESTRRKLPGLTTQAMVKDSDVASPLPTIDEKETATFHDTGYYGDEAEEKGKSTYTTTRKK